MKCDDLENKDYNNGMTAYELMEENGLVNTAKTVKDAIAELKKKLMPCLNGDCILTCEVVEKYGKENAELKQKLEDVQASHYAEMVDAGMRERRLRRALYNACASWAKAYRYPSFRKMERKCRAKAEQYK